MPPPSEGPLGFLGRLASTFAGGAPDGARHAWDGFAPWLQQLSRAATTRWLPNLILGIPCEIAENSRACGGFAIEGCGICHKPVCLDHSFAAKDGSAVCFVCVKKAADAAAPRVPGQKPPGYRQERSRAAPGAQPPPGTGGAPPPRPPNQPSPEASYVAARRVLGVKRHAPWPDVEKAYKKLLARWHPDKHPERLRADAEKRFKEIRAAYDFLKDHPE